MKRFLYLFCLVVLTTGLNSCNKDNDPAPSPVLGKWSLDRIRYTGFTGDYAGYNGDEDATGANAAFRDEFTVKQDNTFNGTQRAFGQVYDYKGTWVFSNNSLTLSTEQGEELTYTLDSTQEPNKLQTETTAVSDTLQNPRTGVPQLVNYSLQLIYSKQ